jgi:hypothetical protein
MIFIVFLLQQKRDSHSINGKPTLKFGDLDVEAYFVPSFKHTLISTPKLLQDGAKVIMKKGLRNIYTRRRNN